METVLGFMQFPDHVATGEADHRIANSLLAISSMVRLKARNAEIEESRRFLLDVAGRIDVVGRLHRLLAISNGEAVPLAQFLRDVCEAMESIAGEEQLRITAEAPNHILVEAQTAIRLGLLTAELISNSAKYAHPTGLPTVINVECTGDRTGLVFSFEDDGVGFPENFDPANGTSLGMRIVRSLSQQLRGQGEWEDLGIGLRFVCRFPG